MSKFLSSLRKKIGALGIIVALIIVIIAIVIIVTDIRQSRRQKTTNKVLYSAITDVRSIVRVTSLEGIRSVPVSYKEDGIGAFGIGTYRFRISYNAEEMDTYIQGDTLLVRLPHEKVTILEDETAGFKVIDVWGTNIFSRFAGAQLTLRQENKMRSKAMAQVNSDIKTQGLKLQARTHAMTMISNMLSLVPGTVIVLSPDDPLPGSIDEHSICPNPEIDLPRPSAPSIRR